MDYSVLTPISFLLRLLETSAEFFMMSVFLDKKVPPKKFIFYVSTFSVILILFRELNPFSTWPFCALLIAIPLLTKMLESVWIKVTVMYVLTIIIVTIFDFLYVFLILFIFKLPSFDSIVNHPYLYYLGILLISFFVYGISFILLNIKKIKFYSFSDKIKNKTILLNSIITFTLLIPNIFILILYFDKKPLSLWTILINIFSIILIFIINVYNIHRILRFIRSEEELAYQKNYNSTLQNLLDGLRTFKHDYNNTLQTLYGYIQLENITALKKIFEQILDESKAINSLDKLNPTLINNPSIFGLITAKYQLCIKNSVTMNFEIFGDLESLDIQIFDLTRILGIFLDNAIEAASGSKERKINFLVSETKSSVTIEISNTYSDKSISTDSIFEKGVSSKGKNRGFGLFEVSKILRKYPNISLTTVADNGNFLQKLIIPKFMKIYN